MGDKGMLLCITNFLLLLFLFAMKRVSIKMMTNISKTIGPSTPTDTPMRVPLSNLDGDSFMFVRGVVK